MTDIIKDRNTRGQRVGVRATSITLVRAECVYVNTTLRVAYAMSWSLESLFCDLLSIPGVVMPLQGHWERASR